MRKPPLNIEWRKPKPRHRKRAMKTVEVTTESASATSMNMDLIMELGIPVPKDVTNAKELALQLLRLASEIEHALMVQYLYAAASIPKAAGAPVDYRRKIVNVAIQEMGHLASVQNLLLLLGGPDAFYLQRDIIRTGNELNPLPFVLEPVTDKSLAKFVVTEMPANIPPEHTNVMKTVLDLTRTEGTETIHRVGILYEFLIWVFTPEEDAKSMIDFSKLVKLPANPHLTEADLVDNATASKFALQREEWSADDADGFILSTPLTLPEARDLLRLIAEQGEGLDQSKSGSHFNEFLELYVALSEHKYIPQEMATAPTIGTHGSKQGNLIDHPYTFLWGQVFSLQYTLLILSIYHSNKLPRTDNEQLRTGLADIALRGMRRIILEVSDLLITLPINTTDASKAGPPYELDPAVFDSGISHVAEDHLRLLGQLEVLYQQIENSPFLATHPNPQPHRAAIKNLRTGDQRRRDLFPAA